MKIDRLLGITIYLLNHKKVSAQALAEYFALKDYYGRIEDEN